METKKFLQGILIALLILFNSGVVIRMITDLVSCGNDDRSPLKIIINYLKIGVSANGIVVIVALIKRYFG